MFKKAAREQVKLKMGMVGVAGSGKTYSALLLAKGLVDPPYEGKIAVVDTENGSAALYGDLVPFDVLALQPPFDVTRYTEAIDAAVAGGYQVIILDSISHAWAGAGGLLDQKDKISKVEKNSFTAWRDVSKKHNAFIDAMLQSDIHLIATMRAKTEYALVEDDRGRTRPQKMGMAPVQREGMDYEFSVVFDIEREEHLARASKDRTSLFGDDIFRVDESIGKKLRQWQQSGVPATVREVATFEKPKPVPLAEVSLMTEIQAVYTQYVEAGWNALDIKKQWIALTNKESTTEFTREDLDIVKAYALTLPMKTEVLVMAPGDEQTPGENDVGVAVAPAEE